MADVANAMSNLSQYHTADYTNSPVQNDHPPETPDPAALQQQTANSSNGNQTTQEESPCINVVINNVVSSFSVRCHINLRKVATEACNVEYKIANGMVSMKLRKPYTTSSIWSSGKITCTGATSEEDAKIAARKVSRILQRLGFRVRMANYRIVNVLGTCSLPFGINIRHFSEEYPKDASYEPELHPGVTYKIKELRATLKIFSTGSLTITAPSVGNVQAAVGHIFPLVYPFKTVKPQKQVSEAKALLDKHYGSRKRKRYEGRAARPVDDVEGSDIDDVDESDGQVDYGSYSEDDDYPSDQSFD